MKIRWEEESKGQVSENYLYKLWWYFISLCESIPWKKGKKNVKYVNKLRYICRVPELQKNEANNYVEVAYSCFEDANLFSNTNNKEWSKSNKWNKKMQSRITKYWNGYSSQLCDMI